MSSKISVVITVYIYGKGDFYSMTAKTWNNIQFKDPMINAFSPKNPETISLTSICLCIIIKLLFFLVVYICGKESVLTAFSCFIFTLFYLALVTKDVWLFDY